MDSAEGEEGVRALLARLFAAWRNGDGTAYASCFSDDCDYITFNGMHLRGRSENASLHGALFQSVLRGSELAAQVERINFLAPGVALIHTSGQRGRKSHQTYVMTKASGDWLIQSFQNTRVQPFSVWVTRLLQRRHGA